MGLKQCHVYHPWLGMVNILIPPIYLWWFLWGMVNMTLGITHLHGFFGETLNCSSMLEALDDMLPRMQPPGAPVFCFCRGVYYVHRKKKTCCEDMWSIRCEQFGASILCASPGFPKNFSASEPFKSGGTNRGWSIASTWTPRERH